MKRMAETQQYKKALNGIKIRLSVPREWHQQQYILGFSVLVHQNIAIKKKKVKFLFWLEKRRIQT